MSQLSTLQNTLPDTLTKHITIESIYNAYLRAKRKGKPYTPRSNFDNIPDATRNSLEKLQNFFNIHRDIDMVLFFESTLDEVPDAPLNYFTTAQAIKKYSTYKEKINLLHPDTDEMVDIGKKNMSYIVKFCNLNNINIDNYITYIAPNSNIPQVLLDIKHCRVLLYTAYCFEGFDNVIQQQPAPILKFILGESIYKLLANIRPRIYSSTKFKPIMKKIISFFQKKVD